MLLRCYFFRVERSTRSTIFPGKRQLDRLAGPLGLTTRQYMPITWGGTPNPRVRVCIGMARSPNATLS